MVSLVHFALCPSSEDHGLLDGMMRSLEATRWISRLDKHDIPVPQTLRQRYLHLAIVICLYSMALDIAADGLVSLRVLAYGRRRLKREFTLRSAVFIFSPQIGIRVVHWQ